MSEKLVGGWSAYSAEISSEQKEVFKTAMGKSLRVNYSRVAVATQVVSGTNYCFFCNAQVVSPNAPEEAALVEIYAPAGGEPTVKNIQKLHHQQA